MFTVFASKQCIKFQVIMVAVLSLSVPTQLPSITQTNPIPSTKGTKQAEDYKRAVQSQDRQMHGAQLTGDG
jgi:hypothetical protein